MQPLPPAVNARALPATPDTFAVLTPIWQRVGGCHPAFAVGVGAGRTALLDLRYVPLINQGSVLWCEQSIGWLGGWVVGYLGGWLAG